jgi:hypothetical protein
LEWRNFHVSCIFPVKLNCFQQNFCIGSRHSSCKNCSQFYLEMCCNCKYASESLKTRQKLYACKSCDCCGYRNQEPRFCIHASNFFHQTIFPKPNFSWTKLLDKRLTKIWCYHHLIQCHSWSCPELNNKIPRMRRGQKKVL